MLMPWWEALARQPEPLNCHVGEKKNNAQFSWELMLPTLGGVSQRYIRKHIICIMQHEQMKGLK